jgi:putative transposase
MGKELIEFSAEKRRQASDRYKIIEPYLTDGIKIVEIEKTSKISKRTLYRWINNYKKDGLIGLVDKKRSNSGKKRKIGNKLRDFIEGLALQNPPLSVAAIHRQAILIAKNNNWAEPSYCSVYRIVKKMKPALKVLAQEGTKAYKDKFDLLYPRKSSYPNEIWQADHCLLDIWLINDKNKPQKPWLTIIIDDYSRAIAGYYLTFQNPNSQNTSLCLHQAIWYKKDPAWHICGIPDKFYTDHGSDFTSLHLEQVSLDIKMVLLFSIVGQPRGRGIVERFFLTINQLFLCELPGYTPNGKRLENPPTMHLGELDNLLKNFLIHKYNLSVHTETNKIPQERWKSGNFIPRLPESLEELDLLLLTESRARKVHQDGIHFQGLKYTEPTLAAYVGEYVVIRYDPRDIVEIRVFHEGKFLCRAINYDLAGSQIISLKDIIKKRNEVRKELKKEIGDKSQLVNELLKFNYEKDEKIEDESISRGEKRKLKRFFYEDDDE